MVMPIILIIINKINIKTINRMKMLDTPQTELIRIMVGIILKMLEIMDNNHVEMIRQKGQVRKISIGNMKIILKEK